MSTEDFDALARRADALARKIDRPRDGRDGRDGRNGKDADPEAIRTMVAAALADMPKPRDGRDADPVVIRAEVERAVGALQLRAGERGPRGPEGPQGPMPRHEWKGTKLRFEEEPGQWGDWVDLRGPAARGGGGNISIAEPATQPTYSYMPSGWS